VSDASILIPEANAFAHSLSKEFDLISIVNKKVIRF
jgi:hypothetical protein